MKSKPRDIEVHRSAMLAVIPKLQGASYSVFLEISFHTNKSGTARLSPKEIKAACGIGDKRFSDAVCLLEQLRMIRVGRRIADGRNLIYVLRPFLRGSRHRAF